MEPKNRQPKLTSFTTLAKNNSNEPNSNEPNPNEPKNRQPQLTSFTTPAKNNSNEPKRPKRTIESERRTFKDEWKLQYF